MAAVTASHERYEEKDEGGEDGALEGKASSKRKKFTKKPR